MTEQAERTWTILDLIEWCQSFFDQHEVPSSRLEAELLLAYTLNLTRVQLYTHFDRPVDSEELGAFKKLVIRRARKREPTAYILGEREFWSLPLEVTPAVLIPRPETERLVELALDLTRDHRDTLARVVDVGTGSGAIAFALASELPHATVYALDLSAEALAVAKRNAERHHLSAQVQFLQSDLLEALPEDALPVDLIVSNPPYVGTDERPLLAPEILDHEPESALFAGQDGLAIIDRLLPQAHRALRPGGFFLCEIGAGQGTPARKRFARAGFQNVEVHKDYSQHDRVVVGTR